MIPLPPQFLAAQAVLKSLPWRLIGYGIAVLALLLFAWRVHAWHQGFLREEATEKALAASRAKLAQCTANEIAQQEALTEAATKAKSTEAADRAAAQKVEHDLQTQLALANDSSRDLARRLRDYQSSRRGCPVPGTAGPAADSASGAGAGSVGATELGRLVEEVERSAAEVDRSTQQAVAACRHDAPLTTGWPAWWAEVSQNR